MSPVHKLEWLVASSCIALAACTFEHGMLTPQQDAPPMIDARPIDAPIPARDPATCPVPPGTCHLFTCPGSTSCYYECGRTSTSKQAWNSARLSCGNGLGCLATINNQVEQDCINTNTQPNYPDFVWFGYYQTDKLNEPAGDWAWACGTSSYTPAGWNSGPGSEPNNQNNNEDCAGMTNAGGWFDANCAGTARFMCELP